MGSLFAGVIAGAVTEAEFAQHHGWQAFVIATDKPELLARLGQPLQKYWGGSTSPYYLEAHHAAQQEREVTGTHRSKAGVQPRGQACWLECWNSLRRLVRR